MQEAKRTNLSSEFVLWKVFFDWERDQTTTTHQYLAQIAREIVVSRNPKKIGPRLKIKDFLLKFKVVAAAAPVTPEQREQRTQQSKNFWFALVKKTKSPPPQKKKG